MKKSIYFFIPILFIIVLFSCKGKQPKSTENEAIVIIEPTEKTETIDNNLATAVLKKDKPTPFDSQKFETTLTEISQDFSQVQQRLINDLLQLNNTSDKALIEAKDVLKKYFKNATAKQCDSLYIAYRTYADLILGYIYNDEYYSQVPADFYTTYDDFDKLPEAYQPIMKELNSYGIQLEDIGEGCADLSFYPDYFYEIFKPYTTEATREYLRLMAFERANEFLFDAAVCITWEQLADRIVNFEEYLDKYPNSIFTNEVKGYYNSYILLLLKGCDNTPTFDWYDNNSRKLGADVYKSYQRIVDTYSHRRLAKILKDYCDLLEKSSMIQSEEIDEFAGQFIQHDSDSEY